MDRDTVPGSLGAPGGEGVPVTILLPNPLDQSLSDKAKSLGISREECLVKALSEDLGAADRLLGPFRAEIGKLAEKNDRLIADIRQELREIDDRNRQAYEALARTMTPSRKEWSLIGGGAVLVALLFGLLVFGFGKATLKEGATQGDPEKKGISLPSQMSEKNKYIYFVGRWYLGVRDRMPSKDRLFIENYLKPFDNFDEDLKARKEAGL